MHGVRFVRRCDDDRIHLAGEEATPLHDIVDLMIAWRPLLVAAELVYGHLTGRADGAPR